MFDRQIFIVIVSFFHHFYCVNIQYHLYFVRQKKKKNSVTNYS